MALVIPFEKRSPWNIYFVNSLRRPPPPAPPPLNSVSQISPTLDPLCVSRGRTPPLFLNNAASCHFVGRDKLRQSREFGIFIQARGGRKATEHRREGKPEGGATYARRHGERGNTSIPGLEIGGAPRFYSVSPQNCIFNENIQLQTVFRLKSVCLFHLNEKKL